MSIIYRILYCIGGAMLRIKTKIYLHNINNYDSMIYRWYLPTVVEDSVVALDSGKDPVPVVEKVGWADVGDDSITPSVVEDSIEWQEINIIIQVCILENHTEMPGKWHRYAWRLAHRDAWRLAHRNAWRMAQRCLKTATHKCLKNGTQRCLENGTEMLLIILQYNILYK